jgi:hypothetical protein
MREFAKKGFILAKIGDSHRDTDIRIAEQGGAAEWEGKVKIGEWNDVKKIDRDFRLHEVLTKRGLWHKSDNAGNEWFKIPGKNAADVRKYVDELIAEFEGERVRPAVKLRNIQAHNLDKAMDIIASVTKNAASIIANLCPRFGKTIWALMLFNRISKKYGNRVMLLPAYWLSVHSSFESELDRFKDFQDIKCIYPDSPEAWKEAWLHIEQGLRIVIPISLHGDYDEWIKKHEWISTIPNEEIFVFADEGDFGTHAENQVAKLNYLFQ